jgi:serine/threonine-protein kinase
MGTPAYMPPEQFLGRTDTTTDVFALGSVLCEILTGQPAGRDPELTENRLDKCSCDASLIELAKTCLARDPTDRPTDAGELATRVAAYLEATESRFQQARLTAVRAEAIAGEERKRQRITMGLAVACTLAAVIAAASWVWVSNLRVMHQKEIDAQYNRVQNEAEVAYGQAEQFYQQAQSAPLRELGDWRVAREAVTRAESLAEAGSLGPETRERISKLSNRIAIGESERNFVLAIEAARRDGIEASKYHQIERPSLERSALISLLRDQGLYPESGQPWERAARQLREYSEEVRDEVIGAIDQALFHAADDEKAWLTRVLQDADRNSWRRSWRRALAERNEADLLRIVRDAELRDQSLRTALNASYSVQTLIPFEERVRKLRELRAPHVNDVWINLRLGRVLASKGRTQEAATYYQAALAVQPSAAVHGVIATVANRQAKYNEAVAHWTEAIRLKPDADSYHLFLAHNLMYEFRYQEAVAAFRRAIELSGPGGNDVVNLSRVLSDETVSKIPEDKRQGWETTWRTVDALFTSNAKTKAGDAN